MYESIIRLRQLVNLPIDPEEVTDLEERQHNHKISRAAAETLSGIGLKTQEHKLKEKALDVVDQTIDELLAWRKANPLLIPRGMTIDHVDEPNQQP